MEAITEKKAQNSFKVSLYGIPNLESNILNIGQIFETSQNNKNW
jgi:hypothetical protein